MNLKNWLRAAECHPCKVWERNSSMALWGEEEERGELQGSIAAWKGKMLGRGVRKQERQRLFC